jgi:RimJ/RimL family protein N-acetyltransferase
MASCTRYALDYPFATPRLALAPVAEEHADHLWAWTRDPRFNEFSGWPRPHVPLQAKALIDEALAAWRSGASFLFFGTRRSGGEAIACVQAGRSERRGTIGRVRLLIAPDQWSQGYGFELIFFGLWFCYEMLNLEVVALDPDSRQGAMLKILDEIGMRAISPPGGVVSGNDPPARIRYVLTRDEFEIRHIPFMLDAGYDVPRPDLSAPGVDVLLHGDTLHADPELLRP